MQENNTSEYLLVNWIELAAFFGQDLFIFFKNLVFQLFSKLVADRMSHVPERSIGGFSAGHTDKVAGISFYYFHAPYDKAAIKCHVHESFQLFFITEADGNFRYFHVAPFKGKVATRQKHRLLTVDC